MCNNRGSPAAPAAGRRRAARSSFKCTAGSAGSHSSHPFAREATAGHSQAPCKCRPPRSGDSRPYSGVGSRPVTDPTWIRIRVSQTRSSVPQTMTAAVAAPSTAPRSWAEDLQTYRDTRGSRAWAKASDKPKRCACAHPFLIHPLQLAGPNLAGT